MRKIFILFSMGLIISSGFSQTLKFRFTFDDKLTDETSNAYELTPGAGNGTTILPTTTVYDEGKYGKAILLNGTNDYFDLNVAAIVTPATQVVSACAWVFNTQTPEQRQYLATGYDEEQVIHIKGQRVILQHSVKDGESNVGSWIGGGSLKSTVLDCFALNVWQHIAVVGDPVTRKNTFFVNGVQMGEPIDVPANFTWTPAGSGYRIGAHQIGDRSFWHGKLDDVCLFEGALTEAQLQKIMLNDYDITSVKQVLSDNELRVFPNPAKDILNLEGVANVKQLTLMTLDGRSLLTSVSTNSIDLSGIVSGNYLLKAEALDGAQGYKKVIVIK